MQRSEYCSLQSYRIRSEVKLKYPLLWERHYVPTWTSILFKKVFSCSFDFVHFPWVVSEVLQNAACLDVSLSLIGPPLIGPSSDWSATDWSATDWSAIDWSAIDCSVHLVVFDQSYFESWPDLICSKKPKHDTWPRGIKKGSRGRCDECSKKCVISQSDAHHQWSLGSSSVQLLSLQLSAPLGWGSLHPGLQSASHRALIVPTSMEPIRILSQRFLSQGVPCDFNNSGFIFGEIKRGT